MDTIKQKLERKQKRINTVNKILNALEGKKRTSDIVNLTGLDKSVVSYNLGVLKGTHTHKVGIWWTKLKAEFTSEEYDEQIKFSFTKKETITGARFISADSYHPTPKERGRGYGKVSIGCSFTMY